MSLLRAIYRLPGLGAALRIANSYAYEGDLKADNRLAGLGRWCRAVLPDLLLSMLLTTLTLWDAAERSWALRTIAIWPLEEFQSKPGSLLVSVIPNCLGFGIGVYALLFILTDSFVRQVHEVVERQKSEGKRSRGSVLMLNSDMAYPLVVLMMALVVGVLQQAFPKSAFWVICGWVSMWYALLSMLAIISVIFRLAEHSLLDKTSQS